MPCGLMGPSEDDRTEPVALQDLSEPSPPRPPPIPTQARRSSAPLLGVLNVRSQPSSATVVIVTAGRAQVAGVTPIRTTVDPRLNHDIIVAAKGYDTVVWRMSPHAHRDVEVHLQVHSD